jgi:hypothetical protein
MRDALAIASLSINKQPAAEPAQFTLDFMAAPWCSGCRPKTPVSQMQSDIPGQFVYVVSSAGNDFFSEMTAVSMASLRATSPQARIVVLADRETMRLETPGVQHIRDMADRVLTVDCPGDSPMPRSRYLKCNMRQLLTGRLFYLDSDTFILRSPHDIWNRDCDVGAAPDLAPSGKPYMASDGERALHPGLNWKFWRGLYLNAGVIYLADTADAHSFAAQYLAAWTEFKAVTGGVREQPAFNRAIALTTTRVEVLPSSYNAQISTNAMTLRGAKIVHYFTGQFDRSVETVAHTIGRRLRAEGMLDVAAIRAAITSGHPWTRIDSYRKAIASGQYRDIARVALDRARKRRASQKPTQTADDFEGGRR